MSRLVLALFTIGYSLVNATSLLLVRSSLAGLPSGTATGDILRHPPVRLVAGLFLYVVSFGAFIASTRFFPISVIFPLLAGGAYAMIVLGGWWILGESISRTQGVGLLTVGVGVILLQMS